MMLQASSVITVVLLLLCDEVRGEQFDCVRTFTDLEISLISRDSNIDSMSDAFYPPNRQVSIAANVYYFFSDGNEPDKDLDVVSYDYAFRWAASPVFELIRPELLQYASLFVYQGQTTTIKIVLKPICEAMPLQTKLIDEETCIGEANTTKPAQMINKLTTHLKSYVLDNRLLGVDENNRGYSSFFFNRNNTKDHCVIGQLGVFTSIRVVVATILVLLQLLTMMGAPPLLVSYYVRLCDIMKDQWDYMWATVLVLVLVDCVVSSLDLWVISDGLHEYSRFGDIKYYYYISFLVIIAHPFVNLFSTIMAALLLNKRAEIQKKYIPCLSPCGNSTLIFCIHCVVIAVIISAVQLVITFQSYFILLAFIASPIHACSILFLYAAGLLCLVVFITFFFKAFSHPKRGCLLVFIIIVVIVLLLFIFVFIQIIILVGEHRNSGGILSFVGSLGPPVLLSAIAYFGNKALKLLNHDTKTKEDPNKSTANKNKDDTPSDNNLVIRHQEMLYVNSETVLRARQSTIIVTHPP